MYRPLLETYGSNPRTYDEIISNPYPLTTQVGSLGLNTVRGAKGSLGVLRSSKRRRPPHLLLSRQTSVHPGSIQEGNVGVHIGRACSPCNSQAR
jgi:hypothetical protein